MARQSKQEYLRSIHERYRKARRSEKTAMLEEFCRNGCRGSDELAEELLAISTRQMDRRLLSHKRTVRRRISLRKRQQAAPNPRAHRTLRRGVIRIARFRFSIFDSAR
jgi:hypothetical protein